MNDTDAGLPALEAVQRVLMERAHALARPAILERAAASEGMVIVSLGVERYGLPMRQVQEVRMLSAVTPVPGTAPLWAGLANLRGRLFPVLDLRHYLALPSGDADTNRKLVVVTAAGLEIALLVDDVLGVRDVLTTEIGPSLADMTGLRSAIVAGVTADLLSILNLDLLLADPRLVVQDEGL
jgi:purine-binding chemotaxis protein CheW